MHRNYARLAGMLLSREARAAGAYAAFATHDEHSIRIIAERAREYGLAADGIHRILRELGVRLRVLVSFGEDWYGHLVRRLAERPASLRLFSPAPHGPAGVEQSSRLTGTTAPPYHAMAYG